MAHFAAIADLLTGRFTPIEAGSATRAKSEKRLTLHDAIKIKLSTEPDWSIIAYANHSDLAEAINFTYSILTSVVGGRADVWAISADRSEQDVLAALMTADSDPRSLDPVLEVAGRARPSIGKIPGTGKVRASIASSTAAISEVTGAPFIEVMRDALARAEDDTDLALLAALDGMSQDPPSELADPTIAIAFSKAIASWLEKSETWKVSAFCSGLVARFPTAADEALLEHLSSIGAKQKA